MPAYHPALRELFGYALYRSGLSFREMLAETLEQERLVPPQLAILTVLKDGGPFNQMQLGEELGIDRASMVKFIDGLEAAGLVERTQDASDRRAKLLSLTSKGRLKYASLRKKEQAVEAHFLSSLTQSEQDALRRIVFKLVAQIGSSKT
ncbi:MAG TPA: MarR family transcriptional regulator [Oligoflexus sp.]|uniref:MarR family winged helix-turn-helix transcriptional regulator n=1 Tax=Oligoflexus sp. TaxID=1971216 RepID=UPI002D3CBBD8|nr:MarR family transcriptional regulator [Oligoflexus sp.]HYX36907.1 MarR family transcriptional regulator [Oligoflexus sp.]